jgi:hypothetical protein
MIKSLNCFTGNRLTITRDATAMKPFCQSLVIALAIESALAFGYWSTGWPFGPWGPFAYFAVALHIPAVLLVGWPLSALGMSANTTLYGIILGQAGIWFVLAKLCISLIASKRIAHPDHSSKGTITGGPS